MLYTMAAIGAGKSSLTKILSEDLGTKAFYEKIDDMPELKEFYSDEAKSRTTKALELQLMFLSYRYNQLQQGIDLQRRGMRNTVYDSSLLSDKLMAGNLHDIGEFPTSQYKLYLHIAQQMQKNVMGQPFSGFPDIVIYLDMSFPTMLKHIKERGREMEKLTDDKIDYYYSVWQTYKAWYKGYHESDKLCIDMDKVDFVHNVEDKYNVLDMIVKEMRAEGLLSSTDLSSLLEKHNKAREDNKKHSLTTGITDKVEALATPLNSVPSI